MRQKRPPYLLTREDIKVEPVCETGPTFHLPLEHLESLLSMLPQKLAVLPA